MTSEIQGFPEEAVLGHVPTHWARGLELRNTPQKSPEPLTLGQVPQKSFVLSLKYHKQTGEVGTVNPFCKWNQVRIQTPLCLVLKPRIVPDRNLM